ncbi:MAG: SH3 domain-containing protein [Desulfocapsa sp.]|nr:SH3 domain-containing protein [Desulfocapsa sp.]
MKTTTKRVKFAIPVVLITIFFFTPAFAQMGSVKGERVQLRSGAGTKYASKWEYGDGFPLKILSHKGRWVKVKDFENDTGWIYKDYVSSTPHMIVKVNKDKKKKINIRSGPGTKYKVVGKAYYGVVFKTLEQKYGWAKVQHESGLTGWIKRSLLWGY